MESYSPLLLVLAACGSEGIEYPSNDLTDPPEGVDEAVELVILELEDHVGPITETPLILWFEGQCLDRGTDSCIRGSTWISTAEDGWAPEIHLALGSADKPSQTSFVHEHIHWALYVGIGDADATHSDDLWNLKKPLIKMLTEAGL